MIKITPEDNSNFMLKEKEKYCKIWTVYTPEFCLMLHTVITENYKLKSLYLENIPT